LFENTRSRSNGAYDPAMKLLKKLRGDGRSGRFLLI